MLRHEVEWPIIIGIAAITSLSYTAVTMLARQTLRIDIGLFHLRDTSTSAMTTPPNNTNPARGPAKAIKANTTPSPGSQGVIGNPLCT
jgi:hypothetical protein